MELTDEDLVLVARLERAREIARRGLGTPSEAAVLAVLEHVVVRDQLAEDADADRQDAEAAAWAAAPLVSVALH